jgi:hypothetical protein
MKKQIPNNSMNIPLVRIVTALILLFFIPGSLISQDRGNPNWYLRVTPYYWFSNLGVAETLDGENGKNIVGDFSVPVEDTLLENSWAMRLEFGKSRYRGIVKLSSANMKNTTDHIESLGDSTLVLPGKYDFTWTTAEFFGAAQVGPFKQNYAIELYGGLRYVHQEQTVESDSLPGRADVDESWVDPVIGARFYIKPGRRWWTTFHSDVGGFGIGTNFTWTLGGELGFVIIKNLDISLAYNYQEIEYDNGKTGAERYIWDNGVQQGWFFGLSFKL